VTARGRTISDVSEAVRVLIVDDHEMARKGLAAMLGPTDWLTIVGEAADCATGLELARRVRPDVVLLDIRMAGGDGLSCIEPLRAVVPTPSIIIVTFYDDTAYILEALRRGAGGYLLKDATAEEVVATIRTVVEGGLAISPDLLRAALTAQGERAADGATDAAPEALAAGPPTSPRQRALAFDLTVREHDVLRLVAEGLTNKEIGVRLGIAEDTVKKHVQNIIWKLRAADRTQAAILAFRLGLLDADELEA
jgi:DNA-binding NarL/FixJ family response regulator